MGHTRGEKNHRNCSSRAPVSGGSVNAAVKVGHAGSAFGTRSSRRGDGEGDEAEALPGGRGAAAKGQLPGPGPLPPVSGGRERTRVARAAGRGPLVPHGSLSLFTAGPTVRHKVGGKRWVGLRVRLSPPCSPPFRKALRMTQKRDPIEASQFCEKSEFFHVS